MKLIDFLRDYRCDARTNNYIHAHFTQMTEANGALFRHRRFVEENKLGFGDRAFHYMWYLLLEDVFERTDVPQLLEIGVYKGQVISLWSMIAKSMDRRCEISAVTPLSGNDVAVSGLRYYLKMITSRSFRSAMASGNLYKNEPYLDAIESIFKSFDLNFDQVRLYRGLSSEKTILSELDSSMFDVIYIDGDHTRKAVETDIANFAPKVKVGGYLVMDDASCNIPGGEEKQYWKGHQSVSDACEQISKTHFQNVLNVGHNRIYLRRQ